MLKMASNETNVDPKNIEVQSEDSTVIKTVEEDPKNKNDDLEVITTAVVATTDLDKKIIRQVEYYFGDVNLPRDKFLQEKITEDDGWVTVECLTTFKRLQQLSTDLEEIAKALKKSTNGLLEINDVDFKVRRLPSKPVPDYGDPMIRKASKLKTLYIKGFPDTYTLDNVEEFLDKLEMKSVFIKMRTDDDRKFKGSIFVELTTQEDANRLLESKELKCEENVLIVMTRDNYFNKKNEVKRNAPEDDKKDAEDDRKKQRKAGCVLHFKGTGEGTSREDLKSLFGEHESISWVDFNRGETEGFVRFREEGAAQKAIDAVKDDECKIMIKDVESTVRVIEGEEEENYWKMVEEDMKKQRQQRGGRGRDRGRGNRGNRGNRGRRGDRNFKRKREWDDGKRENSESKEHIKNDHVRFDDAVKNEGKVSEAKKVKVESEP